MIRRMLVNMRRKYRSLVVVIRSLIKYRKTLRPMVYIVGTPTYGNLGDSAIVIAMLHFFKEQFQPSFVVHEITRRDFEKRIREWQIVIRKKDIIAIPGGGNMGDVWTLEEKTRQRIIKSFPNNKIISFPQTIYFRNPENLSEANEVYSSHLGLRLFARETTSFDLMKRSFPNNYVGLVPDMVFYLDSPLDMQQRANVGLCYRNDLEKMLPADVSKKIEDLCKELGYKTTITDTVIDVNITSENREELVETKISEFASYEFVVTDRLHGMVFCAISGTPCVVFGNNHHKIEKTYSWIKHLPYIQFVSDYDAAYEVIIRFYNERGKKYEPIKFRKEYAALINAIIS